MEGAAVDCVQGHAYVVHGITRLQVKHLRQAWQGTTERKGERAAFVQGDAGIVHRIARLEVKHLHMALKGSRDRRGKEQS